ncbi:DUF6894 family protein [Aurantiacibacter gilvus]|uniref:DUF6894 domain-containing protein n=1 Tax=Aurantiacibacter gilvus TaxID=3139141 RepID=A0ABU9IHR2_9SPHN
MPDFRFVLENGSRGKSAMVLDLPDESTVGLVAKHAARHLAALEVGFGGLDMARDIAVHDASGLVVARYPLTDFIHIA